MERRTFLVSFTAALARASATLPANQKVKWALSAALWNRFPPVPFTDILDVMRDTGFIGVRLTNFPRSLETYGIASAQLQREVDKRNLRVVTISFNGPLHDPAQRRKVLDDARRAMEFLKDFGANHLVVFSPGRLKTGVDVDGAFQELCAGYNQLGELAGEMGFTAGVHNHLGQMVESAEEVERCMALTDAKLFGFSPDTAHLHLAGANVTEMLNRYKTRIRFLDYKDAKWTTPVGSQTPEDRFFASIYDLGDGEIDFPACHHILKSVSYRGWICVDLDTARNGALASYKHCGAYIVANLEPIYR
jgi:sugar phosphate isomerase/epimerase